METATNDILLQRTSARIEELVNLGLTFNEQEDAYEDEIGIVRMDEIKQVGDDYWSRLINTMIDVIARTKELPPSSGEIKELENP